MSKIYGIPVATPFNPNKMGDVDLDTTSIVISEHPPEDTSLLWVDTTDGEPGESLYYTKDEIDVMMGSFIENLDYLLGGEG